VQNILSKMMMCNKFVFAKSWPFYYEKLFIYPICGKYMVEANGYDSKVMFSSCFSLLKKLKN
jgi:hypothetical protein